VGVGHRHGAPAPGPSQPFYTCLVDCRDRPGAQVSYVAEDNVVPVAEPLLDGGSVGVATIMHPLLAHHFASGGGSSSGEGMLLLAAGAGSAEPFPRPPGSGSSSSSGGAPGRWLCDVPPPEYPCTGPV